MLTLRLKFFMRQSLIQFNQFHKNCRGKSCACPYIPFNQYFSWQKLLFDVKGNCCFSQFADWFKKNYAEQTFYGDNLNVLRKFVCDETVDLCHSSPQFNSKRNYNQIYNNIGGKDHAQAVQR